jgi:ornithine cyclodeaminase/alanine dehydrogenase-like protein (mu-crystallin family)
MTLVLNDGDVSRLVTMRECVEVIEEAYRDLGLGRAVNAPRRDSFLPSSRPEAYYSFKTIEGGLDRLGVMAQRINSDLITYPVRYGVARRVKVPNAPGGRYVGLVFLYSTETLELLAIITDGHLQRLRVAATTAVGARHLARADARTLALFGSGWQAEAAAWALAAVRPLERIRVYSPTPERRAALARRLETDLALRAEPASSPDEALRGADIVVTATNAQQPVVPGSRVEPGMHLTCITTMEFDEEAWRRADAIVTSAAPGSYENYRSGAPGLEHVLSDRDRRDGSEAHRFEMFRGKIHLLSDLLVGRAPGRTGRDQITLMDKSWGLGIEFASVGKLVYDRAIAAGAGQRIPDDWFTQTSHP